MVGFLPDDDFHRISVQDPRKGDDHFITFAMADECPAMIEWLDVPPRKGLLIRCPDGGQSPLAGATYAKAKSKKIKNLCDEPAIIFKCVAGCEPKKVPLIIVEQPWEC
ncbi:MAG: hypothetical protein ACK5NS_02370 [Denitromonas sp.]